MSISSYLKFLKEESSSSQWSTAVTLARRNVFHVHSHSKPPNYYAVRVLDTGLGLNPELELFLEDEDWTCDCVSKDDPCIHVLAAAIAINRSIEHRLPLPKFKNELKKIKYQWCEVDHSIRLRRWVVKVNDEGQEIERDELKIPLLSLIAGLKSQAEFAPSKTDIQIDQIMEDMKQVGASYKMRTKLMLQMEQLEADSYVADSLPSLSDTKSHVVTLISENGGLRLKSNQHPSIKKVYRNGFCEFENGIGIFPDRDVAEFLDAFSKEGRFYGKEAVPEVKSKIIPSLEKWASIRGDIGEKAEYQKPHVRFFSEESPTGIKITPRIFYGSPPVAYIESDKMKLLANDSSIPLRDHDSERILRDDLWQQRRLTLNEPIEFGSLTDFKKLESFHSKEVYGVDLKDYKVRGSLKPMMIADHKQIRQLTFVSRDDSETFIPFREVLASYERGESLLKMPEGGVFELPVNWLSENIHLLQELSHASESNSSSAKITVEMVSQSIGGESESLTLDSEISFATPAELELELKMLNLRADLRDYQKFGVTWLLRLRSAGLGAMLADDMGLGKTLQSIAVLNPGGLVVCPTSLIDNWKIEIERFRPEVQVALYHGANRSLDDVKDKVVVTSYGILRRDIEKLARIKWTTLVVDESQNIKNHKSLLFQSLIQLKSDFNLALSGTPIENKIDDLWSQMHFINPGYFGKLADFKKNYSSQQLEKYSERKNYLKKKLSAVLLRRMKSEVATDLPPKTEVTRLLHMSEKERELYEGYLFLARKEIMNELNETPNITSILQVILRLRQICCDPQLVNSDLSQIPSTKIRYLKGNLEEAVASGHKVIIISQWTKYLDILEKGLSEYQGRALRIDGHSDNRQEIVNRFQTDDDIKILFLSLKAGGVGLNLTAADYVFSMDPWWNPAVETQAHDRVYRIGQNKPVFIERVIMKNTIEERIIELQKKKLNLSFDLIDSAASPSLEMSKEDLISLLA